MMLEWDQDELWEAARNNDPGSIGAFWDALRQFCPKPGNDRKKVVIMQVKTGRQIRPHTHPEWTLLYYLEPANTPIIINDKPYIPKSGELIVLEPDVLHSVAKNESDKKRISFAMLVEKDEQGKLVSEG